MVRHDTTDNRVNIKHNVLFYVGVFTDVDQEGGSFVCEQYTLYELVKGLCRKCECGFVRLELVCGGYKRRQWWASSRVFGGRYLINQKCAIFSI